MFVPSDTSLVVLHCSLHYPADNKEPETAQLCFTLDGISDHLK